MNINLSDFETIKKEFVGVLEKKNIRKGVVDIFLRDRIHIMEKDGRKSITLATIRGSWVWKYDRRYNKDEEDRSNDVAKERRLGRRR
jgi:hypothetical protein